MRNPGLPACHDGLLYCWVTQKYTGAEHYAGYKNLSRRSYDRFFGAFHCSQDRCRSSMLSWDFGAAGATYGLARSGRMGSGTLGGSGSFSAVLSPLSSSQQLDVGLPPLPSSGSSIQNDHVPRRSSQDGASLDFWCPGSTASRCCADELLL